MEETEDSAEHETAYQMLAFGLVVFLFLAGFGVSIYAIGTFLHPQNNEQATYNLLKTALENDEIWVKGNCSFDIDKVAASEPKLQSIFWSSSPLRNVHCEIYELKIGKVK